MPVRKPWTRLALLGIVAPVALSACATWSGYRAPQGASSEVLVTPSPPTTQIAANPDTTSPVPGSRFPAAGATAAALRPAICQAPAYRLQAPPSVLPPRSLRRPSI